MGTVKIGISGMTLTDLVRVARHGTGIEATVEAEQRWKEKLSLGSKYRIIRSWLFSRSYRVHRECRQAVGENSSTWVYLDPFGCSIQHLLWIPEESEVPSLRPTQN